MPEVHDEVKAFDRVMRACLLCLVAVLLFDLIYGAILIYCGLTIG